MKALHIVSATAALILTLTAASCSAPGKTSSSSGLKESTDPQSSLITETAETKPKLEIPDSDFGGYTFNILVFKNQTWSHSELDVGEISGDVLDDAFYNRNRAAEELLNIVIKQHTGDTDAVATTYRNSISAGDGAYDVCFLRQQRAAELAIGGYCIDLNTLGYVDFTKPWWDINTINDLSLGNKSYLAASDISVGDKEAIWVIYFDKLILENYRIDDPYKIVLSGGWTIDVMLEMARAAAKDIDGDGIMTKTDQYGLLTHSENFAASWIGANEKLAKQDKNGNPVVSFNNDRFATVWDKICELMGDKSCYTKDIPFISSGLRDGQTLFATEVIAFMRQYRVNERDFGIIPMPKYDESQSSYKTYVAMGTTLMVVGKDIRDYDRTGIILEALAAMGRETILPAYYDVSLKLKFTRDEKSADMLDICFSTRCFDLGLVFNWAGIGDAMKSSDVNLSSLTASKLTAINAEIQKTIEQYSSNN